MYRTRAGPTPASRPARSRSSPFRADRRRGKLAHDIDAATNGETKTLTKSQAVLSSPGTREQKSTFAGIIDVTFLVVGLVVALFFVLLTIERISLYGVLKALGASTPRLAAGVITQALAVGIVAFAVGELLTLGLAALLPAQIPLQLQPSRAVLTLVGVDCRCRPRRHRVTAPRRTRGSDDRHRRHQLRTENDERARTRERPQDLPVG